MLITISSTFQTNDFLDTKDKNVEIDLSTEVNTELVTEVTDEKEENIPAVETVFNNSYVTNRSKAYMVTCPEFTFEYSDHWKVSKEELQAEYEWDVLENERGVEIHYYESNYGFPTYDGGGYTLRCAKITKVADAAFKPGYVQARDFSSLGNFVVVKLEEYAQMDGLSGEENDVDGIVVYAVVPESYLGEVSFKGSGFWGVLAWDYPSPRVMLVTSPDGSFTYEEEQEIIHILSTFRET